MPALEVSLLPLVEFEDDPRGAEAAASSSSSSEVVRLTNNDIKIKEKNISSLFDQKFEYLHIYLYLYLSILEPLLRLEFALKLGRANASAALSRPVSNKY